jgi:hypothetical protein
MLRRFKQRVVGQLEINKCSFSVCVRCSIIAQANLVRVKTSGQTAEFGFDLTVGGGRMDT